MREDIFGNEVLSDSFNIYRRERDSTVVAKSKKCHGGGDLVAVNRTYCSVCKKITDVQTLRSLYIYLARSQLEYISVIWNP